jgi:hypothetical protein
MKKWTGVFGVIAAIILASLSIVGTPQTTYAAAGTTTFNCVIPELGEESCGNILTLHPNNKVEVCLDSSGNNDSATFRLKRVANNQVVASKLVAPPPSVNPPPCSGIIYQNTTGAVEQVFFTADSTGLLVRTQFQGRYIVS